MKKSTKSRPVSEKAYQRFVYLIETIIPGTDRRAKMLDALEKYLRGDRYYYRAFLDDACDLAFDFLRVEIDAAIRRSAAARERAAKRREEREAMRASAAVTSQPVENVSDTDAHDMYSDGCVLQNAPVTRCQRRADERAVRPKEKWRKIG